MTFEEPIAVMSKMLDNSMERIGYGEMVVTWARITKVGEEAGEVIDALNGATGMNPRKGVSATWIDVQKELLDTAATALLAWEHVNGNRGGALEALIGHVEHLLDRHIRQVGQ
jgi:NTP pyrophosphatase (non-canonical NTP hydrolase)